jgi:hypothetical protein
MFLQLCTFYKRRVLYCHMYVCDYRRGLDWSMYLLTTYTHDSELQVLTTLWLIYTLYKSLERTRSLLSMLSLVVSL